MRLTQDIAGAVQSAEQAVQDAVNWGEIWGLIDNVLQYKITISGEDITILSGFAFVGVLIATWVVSRVVRQGLTRVMKVRGIEDEGSIAVFNRIIHYFIMGLGILTGLQQIGIQLSALFAAGAVFAVGIGFAFQNLSENFVSGVILMIERSIKPGDIVSVDGYTVRVLRLGIRTTVCRTRDEEEIIVPNSILVSNSVKNYTLEDSIFRLRATVGVAYESDMKRVMKVLTEMAEGLEWRIQSRDPRVFLTEFGSSSVNFEVSVWTDDPWGAPRFRSEMMEGVWHALKDNDITIAFPQIDVHFDSPVAEGFAGLKAVPGGKDTAESTSGDEDQKSA